MTLEISNDYGKIDISNEVIASVVGGKAVECYGTVGMASQQQLEMVCKCFRDMKIILKASRK